MLLGVNNKILFFIFGQKFKESACFCRIPHEFWIRRNLNQWACGTVFLLKPPADYRILKKRLQVPSLKSLATIVLDYFSSTWMRAVEQGFILVDWKHVVDNYAPPSVVIANPNSKIPFSKSLNVFKQADYQVFVPRRKHLYYFPEIQRAQSIPCHSIRIYCFFLKKRESASNLTGWLPMPRSSRYLFLRLIQVSWFFLVEKLFVLLLLLLHILAINMLDNHCPFEISFLLAYKNLVDILLLRLTVLENCLIFLLFFYLTSRVVVRKGLVLPLHRCSHQCWRVFKGFFVVSLDALFNKIVLLRADWN